MRPNFVETTREFRAFLESQRWPTNILWLNADRILRSRQTRWILRPDTLTDESRTAAFYERLRQSAASVRVDGLAIIDGQTVAYVEDYGGTSGMLNYGVVAPSPPVHVVNSEFRWYVLRLWLRLRNRGPQAGTARITP